MAIGPPPPDQRFSQIPEISLRAWGRMTKATHATGWRSTLDPGTIDVRPRQRLLALARANRVRQARAELKRRIADGDMSAAEVILFHERELEGMPLADVLTSQQGWGSTRCRRFLIPMRVEGAKTIGSLTERQRLALATQLTARGMGRTDQRAGSPPWP
jgi:hypothetical protein